MRTKKTIWTTGSVWAEEDKDIHPQPSKNFIPKWLRTIPPQVDNGNTAKLLPKLRTVKKCPSFAEIYKEGFILVAPFDIWLSIRTEDGKEYMEWRTPHKELELDVHPHPQMVDHLPKDSGVRGVFKLIYPFKCITPKGYSIRQMPLFYHFNKDWVVPYGVVNTDKHHELNIQILYTSTEDEVLIKKGTPIVQIIPFKRSDRIKMVYKKYTEKLHRKTLFSNFFIFTVFQNGYSKHNFKEDK